MYVRYTSVLILFPVLLKLFSSMHLISGPAAAVHRYLMTRLNLQVIYL
jgi:hypothetical protein